VLQKVHWAEEEAPVELKRHEKGKKSQYSPVA
jgi:hypothetical protein